MWRNPNKFFHDIIKFIGQPGGNICGIERPKVNGYTKTFFHNYQKPVTLLMRRN